MGTQEPPHQRRDDQAQPSGRCLGKEKTLIGLSARRVACNRGPPLVPRMHRIYCPAPGNEAGDQNYDIPNDLQSASRIKIPLCGGSPEKMVDRKVAEGNLVRVASPSWKKRWRRPACIPS
jgi:hypothetical protein